MRVSYKLKKTFILFLLMFFSSAFASTQEEIIHLMAFIGSTDCQYERNGKIHTGIEAVKHIKSKSDYYSEKINTAEDFIQYAATKSTLTGRLYQVHCNGKPSISSHDWLMNELLKYRRSSND